MQQRCVRPVNRVNTFSVTVGVQVPSPAKSRSRTRGAFLGIIEDDPPQCVDRIRIESGHHRAQFDRIVSAQQCAGTTDSNTGIEGNDIGCLEG